jgi:preprotein translocase subunit SecE
MKLINYLKETKGELKHVSWPTKMQTVYFTIIVIVLSLITAFFLGFFDTIFAKLLQSLIQI